MQEIFGALQDADSPMQLSEVPLLGNISVIMFKERRDETSLRLNDSHQ